MTYPAPIAIRDPYPQVYCLGRARTARIAAHRDGELLPAVGPGTFSLLAPGGRAIVDAEAVTITEGVASYTIPAEVLVDTLRRGGSYIERWSPMWEGREHPVDREVAMSRVDLYPVITDADLIRVYPTLDRHRGTTIGSYQGFLDAAWGEIIRRMLSEGILTYAVMSPTALADLHRELTLAHIARAFMASQGVDTRWSEAKRDHLEAYERAWKTATWRTDEDLDGLPDGDARRGPAGVIHINVAPEGSFRRFRRGWSGGW